MLPLERRQIEKTRNAIYIEQMQLFGSSCQAYRDHRQPGQQRIALPTIERNRGEQVVIANDRIRLISRRFIDCLAESDNRSGVHAQRGEEPTEMIAQIRM